MAETGESPVCDECGVYVVNPRVHSMYHRKARWQAANIDRALASLRDALRRLRKASDKG